MSKIKYADMCRFCLSTKVEGLAYPIEMFEQQFKEITKFELAKPRSAEDESKFPSKVCGSCAGDIDQFIVYKTGLLQRQQRLNLLLGVKVECVDSTDDAVVHQSNSSDHKHDPGEFSRFSDQEEEEPDEETLIKMIDPEDEEKSIKTEHNDPNYETIYYEHYEENSQDDEYEHLDEQDEHNTTASDSEEIYEESPQDDDEEEKVEHDMETTIDQVEEDYELEEDAEDFQYFVKNEDPAADDFMEVAIEEEVVQQATKRKYTKQSKDSPRPYKCWIDKCGTTFAHRNSMKKHMEQLHEISSTKSTCLMCGENFGCYADCLKHVKVHTRKSQCDVCKLTFVDDDKMLKHKARFHKSQDLSGRNFECQICNARFKRKEHLNSHTVYKHSDKDARKFPCKDCSSSFLTRQDLKNHEKSHSQVKTECPYCSYNCRDLKSIKRHCMKKHNTMKIYKCLACDDKFEAYREFSSHKKLCESISIGSE